MELEFKPFQSINQIGKLYMSVTQKLHGTNAQILIEGDRIIAGCRTRWLSPGKETDNFGFAQFVEDNKQELIEKLGEGRHYGEWCGPGINNGEGLPNKMLFLFNWRRHLSKEEYPKLPITKEVIRHKVYTVPLLYNGAVDGNVVALLMETMKLRGSFLNSFCSPEGVVIEINNAFYKKVFKPEETRWTSTKKPKTAIVRMDVEHLLQPIRLEKLLSRDEAFIRDYPESLPALAKAYIEDLVKEEQITGTEDEQKAIRKSLGKCLFPFLKEIVESSYRH